MLKRLNRLDEFSLVENLSGMVSMNTAKTWELLNLGNEP